MKLLIVGAQPAGLGRAIADVAREAGMEVLTAGISDEQYGLDLVHDSTPEIENLLHRLRPDHIVCTAGINRGGFEYKDRGVWWQQHMEVNAIGPMRLLDAWLAYGPDVDVKWSHYVAISSNSANIPRTSSAAYCASKAALSMALRVRARDCARIGARMSVYGYEPGLLAGTPMTNETERRFPGKPLTRMVGTAVEHGLSPYGLAGHVVRNVSHGGPELNGCLLRIDAGEI